jgi:PAT family beta-lactamase induction signal transducer AmpG
MAMADSRRQRIITLCGLYVAQGVPWGFMLITLPSYLAFEYKDQFGVDEIGKLKAIILIPWSFKLIWAPLMDTFTFRPMGRRRPWIIGAELMMAVSLLGFIGLGDLSEKLQLILFMYFLHNCFASLQDVCTDALAVDILLPEEHGQMNGMMWGSKLVGKGIGAWGLAVVLDIGGLEACVAVQVGLLLLIMLIPMFILERQGERRLPWSAGQASEITASIVRKPREILRAYLRAFSLTTTLVFVLFTLAKLIGSGVNETITNTLCTQELSPRWTPVEFSRVTGLYAFPSIMIGAVLGGMMADRFGRRKILIFGFGGYALVAMIFAACPGMWNERWFTTSYILLYETLGAIGSVGFLSMAMRISWTTAAATVFTTYMTLSNVSHVVGNWLAGPVLKMLTISKYGDSATLVSYEFTFWFVGLVTFPPLLLLFFVKQDEVREAREALAAETEVVA